MVRAHKRIAAVILAIACVLSLHGAFAWWNAAAQETQGEWDEHGVQEEVPEETPSLGFSEDQEDEQDEDDREPEEDKEPGEEILPPEETTAPPEDSADGAVSLGFSGMRLLAGNAVEVKTEAAFREAITGGLYDVIYLGNDIEMRTSGRVEIKNPTILVIDGQGHTINEMATDRYINVQKTAAGSHLTLQNVNVIGYDYYGIIGSRDVDVPDATLIFDRVTYSGPQLTHWRGVGSGKTVIRNCNITIEKHSGSHDPNEVWEGAILEFEGDTSITHNSTSHATFACYVEASPRPEYGGASRGYVLKAGANVTVNALNYVFETHNSSKTALIVEDRATFTVTSSGFMRGSDYVQYLELGRDAVLQLQQSGTRSSTAFNVQKQFIMHPGSVFRAEKSTSQVAAHIYGNVRLDNPRLFLVRSASTGLQVDGARNWSVNGVNAVNFTSTTDRTFYWNLQEDSLPQFDWTATSAGIDAPAGLTDIYGNAMNTSHFNLTATRSLSVGNYAVGLGADAAMQATSVDGVTAPAAYVEAGFYPQGLGVAAAFTTNGNAAADGSFSLPIGDNTMVSSHPDSTLHLRGYDLRGALVADRLLPIVDRGEASLQITSELDFGVQAIPGSRNDLIGRVQTMSIRLDDTAMTARDWQLLASERVPLDGPTTVPGAFVFRKGGSAVRLNSQDQLIAEFQNPGGMMDWSQQLDYAQNEGILISVAPGEVLTGDYTGVITWTLVNA